MLQNQRKYLDWLIHYHQASCYQADTEYEYGANKSDNFWENSFAKWIKFLWKQHHKT